MCGGGVLYENRSKEELSKAKLDKISLRLVTVFMGSSSKIGHGITSVRL